MSLLEGLPLAAVRTNGASAEAFLWQFGGPRPAAVGSTFLVGQALARADLDAYAALRRLVEGADQDELDGDPDTVVLVARDPDGTVHGGVRLAPAPASGGRALGWWVGSRLVVAPAAPPRTGAALVRAACARAEAEGALRFDAVVQADRERFFTHLGWQSRGRVEHGGTPHVRMRWPIGLLAGQAAAKQVIAEVLGDLRPGGEGFIGDDGAPIPTTDLVAATDAILPSMVERDPWWAGWCSVLVNANDLAAMGAAPVGLLDTVAGPTASFARRVVDGIADAADRYGIPLLGGHTQVGVPPALSVAMMGRTDRPIPGGGGRPGDIVRVIADVAGRWRQGYGGRQWDSTTSRPAHELRHMTSMLQRVPVRAAKDVSLAGLVGTLGMLAESSGCGAELDVAAVPRPEGVRLAEWLTCFPGFALVTAGEVPIDPAEVAPARVGACGKLIRRAGVTLVWPDGERTRVLDGPVVGLGPAGRVSLPVAEGAALRPFRVATARPRVPSDAPRSAPGVAGGPGVVGASGVVEGSGPAGPSDAGRGPADVRASSAGDVSGSVAGRGDAGAPDVVAASGSVAGPGVAGGRGAVAGSHVAGGPGVGVASRVVEGSGSAGAPGVVAAPAAGGGSGGVGPSGLAGGSLAAGDPGDLGRSHVAGERLVVSAPGAGEVSGPSARAGVGVASGAGEAPRVPGRPVAAGTPGLAAGQRAARWPADARASSIGPGPGVGVASGAGTAQAVGGASGAAGGPVVVAPSGFAGGPHVDGGSCEVPGVAGASEVAGAPDGLGEAIAEPPHGAGVGDGSGTPSAGVDDPDAESQFEVPPRPRPPGWSFRSAAEGARMAGAQVSRSGGSEAVRGFVGGPFPNVVGVAQGGRTERSGTPARASAPLTNLPPGGADNTAPRSPTDVLGAVPDEAAAHLAGPAAGTPRLTAMPQAPSAPGGSADDPASAGPGGRGARP